MSTTVISLDGRRLERWSATCTHWIGRESLAGDRHRHYSFVSESAALLWLNSGTLNDGSRQLSSLEAARGCPCHHRVVVVPGRASAS